MDGDDPQESPPRVYGEDQGRGENDEEVDLETDPIFRNLSQAQGQGLHNQHVDPSSQVAVPISNLVGDGRQTREPGFRPPPSVNAFLSRRRSYRQIINSEPPKRQRKLRELINDMDFDERKKHDSISPASSWQVSMENVTLKMTDDIQPFLDCVDKGEHRCVDSVHVYVFQSKPGEFEKIELFVSATQVMTKEELTGFLGLSAGDLPKVRVAKFDWFCKRMTKAREQWRADRGVSFSTYGLLRPDSREDRLLHMMKQIEENGWSMDHCQLYDFSTANTYRIALTSKIRECPVPGADRPVVRVFVLIGDSRSGKTQFVQNRHGMEGSNGCYWNDSDAGWFNGYKPLIHRALMIDEIQPGGVDTRLSSMLINRICNKGGFQVNVKYSHACLTAVVIYLVSNYELADWFSDARQAQILTNRVHWFSKWTKSVDEEGAPAYSTTWWKGPALLAEEAMTGRDEAEPVEAQVDFTVYPPPPSF